MIKKMNIKTVHHFSGTIISIFVGVHLFNHAFSILGAEYHIEMMTTLRHFYRNLFAEIILFSAITFQIYSGIYLLKINRKSAKTFFEKLHVWTGLYLAIFFIIHLGAILTGRYVLKLDTNFYFGVAGMNTFPLYLFFIPYYAVAIISFFGHIASIHNKKMKKYILGLNPLSQSKIILTFGVLLTIITLYGLTNHFQGVTIPAEFKILMGR